MDAAIDDVLGDVEYNLPGEAILTAALVLCADGSELNRNPTTKELQRPIAISVSRREEARKKMNAIFQLGFVRLFPLLKIQFFRRAASYNLILSACFPRSVCYQLLAGWPITFYHDHIFQPVDLQTATMRLTGAWLLLTCIVGLCGTPVLSQGDTAPAPTFMDMYVSLKEVRSALCSYPSKKRRKGQLIC